MDFTWLTNILQFVLDKIDKLAGFFGDLFKAVFIALWSMMQDLLCLGIDALLGGITAALQGVSALVPSGVATTWASYWAAIPASVQETAIAVGIVPMLAIISAAIVIRFALQLIPLVRLGS